MRNLRTNKRCLLIDEREGSPASAEQFARLRGFEVLQPAESHEWLSRSGDGSRPLIAISFAAFARIGPRAREHLRTAVENGATLYIRGEAAYGIRCQLAPLLDASFTVGRTGKATTCRFTNHALLPHVLRGEEGPAGDALNCAYDLGGPVEPILLARGEGGSESPVIFEYRVGSGTIICDVQPEDESGDAPLIWRLADPEQRRTIVGALVAAERAAGRHVSTPVAFNLTIDDIPLGYDYFNGSMLEAFFSHIESRGVSPQVDCAWIPANQRVDRRYVEILKAHRAGFVWHGMHRHVDHQKIDDPKEEMEAGKRAMANNARRYGIQIQPLIIFPFERAHRNAEAILLEQGFLAAVEQPRNNECAAGMPACLRYCSESCVHESGLRFLHRYEAPFLTRDRMIAIASMGMPILAFGHPKNVRLRRLSRFVERGGKFSYFDEVLDFAAEKGLPARSLEEIAREVFVE